MYFPGEELNDKDELLARHRRLKQHDRVKAKFLPVEKDMELTVLRIEFNIVVPTPHSVQALKAR